MKIYTKTGDDGSTSLFGGQRVLKSDLRIDAYGTVDELNSQLGWIASMRPDAELSAMIERLQHLLFTLGADLATPFTVDVRIDRISEDNVSELEQMIDSLDARLAPLRSFILPGGSPTSAGLHIARTICRRAERILIHARETESISEEASHFLNRLSDLLFVMARFENASKGVDDVKWIPR
jgi:cob(I)alamin adenosyltransferase